MIAEQFETLAHPLRRRLLVKLLEHNPQEEVPVPEGVHIGERDLQTLHHDMHHVHLPKLEEAGFIRWNQDQKEAVKGPRFDEIKPLLSLIDAHADKLPADWP